MNGTTRYTEQCSGDDSSPCNVSNITCVVEWYNLSPCHSERTNVSRGIFPSGKFYLVVVLSPTWWIPPLRCRCGRNDKEVTFLRIRLLFLQHFTLPRGPHQARPGEPASPKGSSCTVLSGLWFSGTALKSAPRPSPSGKGDRRRRWMRRGTAFRIVGTRGAEVQPPSETVGNGLRAVPETPRI